MFGITLHVMYERYQKVDQLQQDAILSITQDKEITLAVKCEYQTKICYFCYDTDNFTQQCTNTKTNTCYKCLEAHHKNNCPNKYWVCKLCKQNTNNVSMDQLNHNPTPKNSHSLISDNHLLSK